MKVVFFGTPDYVEPVINALARNFELLRSFRNPKELKSKTIQELKNLNPDLFVVASFGKIFSENFLAIPKRGTLNIHPSLLPKYRGPTPVQTAILNGDKKTGVTIIKLDEEVDHGPILVQEEIEIRENETSESLLKKTFELGAEILPSAVSKYIKEQIKVTAQNDSEATYTQHLSKKSGFINISFQAPLINLDNPQPSETLDRMIRAYFPWPGVWFRTTLGGQNRVIKLLPDQKIQVEGRKSMSYKDFINGYSEGRKILEQLGQLDN